jgi:hypothetical protein
MEVKIQIIILRWKGGQIRLSLVVLGSGGVVSRRRRILPEDGLKGFRVFKPRL